MKDQVSYSYKKKKGKITTLYTLISIFLGSKLENKQFLTEW